MSAETLSPPSPIEDFTPGYGVVARTPGGLEVATSSLPVIDVEIPPDPRVNVPADPTAPRQPRPHREPDYTHDGEPWVQPQNLSELSVDKLTGEMAGLKVSSRDSKEEADRKTSMRDVYNTALDVAANRELDETMQAAKDAGKKKMPYLGKTRDIQLQTIKYRAASRLSQETEGDQSAFQDFTENREAKYPKGMIVKTAESIGRLLLVKNKPELEQSDKSISQDASDHPTVEMLRQVSDKHRRPEGFWKNAKYLINPSVISEGRAQILQKKLLENENITPTKKASYLSRYNTLVNDSDVKPRKAHKLAKREASIEDRSRGIKHHLDDYKSVRSKYDTIKFPERINRDENLSSDKKAAYTKRFNELYDAKANNARKAHKQAKREVLEPNKRKTGNGVPIPRGTPQARRKPRLGRNKPTKPTLQRKKPSGS